MVSYLPHFISASLITGILGFVVYSHYVAIQQPPQKSPSSVICTLPVRDILDLNISSLRTLSYYDENIIERIFVLRDIMTSIADTQKEMSNIAQLVKKYQSINTKSTTISVEDIYSKLLIDKEALEQQVAKMIIPDSNSVIGYSRNNNFVADLKYKIEQIVNNENGYKTAKIVEDIMQNNIKNLNIYDVLNQQANKKLYQFDNEYSRLMKSIVSNENTAIFDQCARDSIEQIKFNVTTYQENSNIMNKIMSDTRTVSILNSILMNSIINTDDTNIIDAIKSLESTITTARYYINNYADMWLLPMYFRRLYYGTDFNTIFGYILIGIVVIVAIVSIVPLTRLALKIIVLIFHILIKIVTLLYNVALFVSGIITYFLDTTEVLFKTEADDYKEAENKLKETEAKIKNAIKYYEQLSDDKKIITEKRKVIKEYDAYVSVFTQYQKNWKDKTTYNTQVETMKTNYDIIVKDFNKHISEDEIYNVSLNEVEEAEQKLTEAANKYAELEAQQKKEDNEKTKITKELLAYNDAYKTYAEKWTGHNKYDGNVNAYKTEKYQRLVQRVSKVISPEKK